MLKWKSIWQLKIWNRASPHHIDIHVTCNPIRSTWQNYSNVNNIGVCKLKRWHTREMVAFPEARKVSARRRHFHKDFSSCGDPAAGPRHGGRPPAPPHYLAAPSARTTAPRPHRTTTAAAPSPTGLATARSLRRSSLETKFAFCTPPRLRQCFTCPTSRVQLFIFIIGSKHYVVVDTWCW